MNAIVYPKKSLHGAMYPAISLQYKLFLGGVTIPLATEETENAAEVVIREQENMEKGCFTVENRKGKLYVEASDLFGFIAASDYLTGTLFQTGEATIPAVSYTGKYTGQMPNERVASHRIMYHNVWSYDPNGRNFGTRGEAYEIAQVKTYSPDVVGFNEFVDEWRSKTSIMEQMEAMGYREVNPPEINRLMINALFYNTKTVRYVEDSCHMAFYGSLNEDENHLAFMKDGRYYNDTPSRYRGVVAAVFEEIATGKRFGVAITHLVPNAYSVEKKPTDGDPWRKEEVSKLIPFIKKMSETYNAPFCVGGDYNSTASLLACRMMEESGFVDSHGAAEDTDDLCSCHGYPNYCKELDNFVTYSCPGIEEGKYFGYDRGIDHIYTLGNIDAKRYRVLFEKTALCTSDHCPVMLDFEVK